MDNTTIRIELLRSELNSLDRIIKNQQTLAMLAVLSKNDNLVSIKRGLIDRYGRERQQVFENMMMLMEISNREP